MRCFRTLQRYVLIHGCLPESNLLGMLLIRKCVIARGCKITNLFLALLPVLRIRGSSLGCKLAWNKGLVASLCKNPA